VRRAGEGWAAASTGPPPMEMGPLCTAPGARTTLHERTAVASAERGQQLASYCAQVAAGSSPPSSLPMSQLLVSVASKRLEAARALPSAPLHMLAGHPQPKKVAVARAQGRRGSASRKPASGHQRSEETQGAR